MKEPHSEGVANHRAHWDDILRLATSIKQGTVTASLMLGKLGSYPRQNGLAVALRELGRIERTLLSQSTRTERNLVRRRIRGESGESGGNPGGIRDRSTIQRLLPLAWASWLEDGIISTVPYAQIVRWAMILLVEMRLAVNCGPVRKRRDKPAGSWG